MADRAAGARDEGPPIHHEPSGATEDPTAEKVRPKPDVRVDPARIEARAPRGDLSPAQALDMVRRATRHDRDDPRGTA